MSDNTKPDIGRVLLTDSEPHYCEHCESLTWWARIGRPAELIGVEVGDWEGGAS